jgi:5'-3' exoribonuclease 2
MSIQDEDTTVKHIEQGIASDVTRMTSSTIQTLCKLGTYAASSGGSQVTLLNVSWKGVVSLLQSGKGMIEEKINVREIILILLSLPIESLRVAAETWCTPLPEAIGTSEARRAFLPIKFFLINTVRICSAYPSEAMSIHRNIIRCALVITSASILFSKKPQLKAANEALVELLEPTLFVLLDTLMKSSEVTPDSKCQIARYFFENEEANSSDHMTSLDSLDCIFSTDSDVDHRNRALLPAELVVFLHLLNASSWLTEVVVIELSKKLQTLLNILTSEDIYSCVLGFKIPALYGADHSPAVVWQPVYTSLIQALKTFMISAVASSAAWNELEAFLLENLFHPHFLCLEIITALWCFFMRYAETETSINIVSQLFVLLKIVASPQEVLVPLSTLRKVARSLCIILSYASSATVDQVYTCVLNDENSSKSSILHLALLMEGFPFDSLSVGIKELALKKVFSSFAGYVESYSKNHPSINAPPSSCGVIGLPVHALASALQRW